MSTVIIADQDDPDLPILIESARVDALVFTLGLPADQYELRWKKGEWVIATPGSSLRLSDLKKAKRIVFRRWRSSPGTPIVAGTVRLQLESPMISYIERQWEATLLGLLACVYEAEPSKWSRNPLHVDNKIVVGSVLSRFVRIPPYSVCQDLSEIPSGNLVAKPIALDQSFGDGKRVAAFLVGESDRTSLQPCPMIVQKEIKTKKELRVVFCFGHVGAVLQVRNRLDLAVDRRMTVADTIEPYISDGLADGVRSIANALKLALFTADVLLSEDGAELWLDINPDGLIGPFENDDHTLSSVLQKGLCSAGFSD